MKKFVWIFVIIVAVTLGFPILFVALLIGRDHIFPVSDVQVPVPIPSAQVSVQTWAEFSDGSYWLTVRNSHGKLVEHLWDDWGPAQRSNYYLTPEGWLAVLGRGDLVALVEIPVDGLPRSVGQAVQNKITAEHSETWEYLGAVDGNPSQKFSPPHASNECVQKFDSNEARYRRAHVGGRC